MTITPFDTDHIMNLRSRLWRAETDARNLRELLAAAESERAAELAAEADPALRFPCGSTHACRRCSPNRILPGRGCINCRQTGLDQSPCLACNESVRVTGPVGGRIGP